MFNEYALDKRVDERSFDLHNRKSVSNSKYLSKHSFVMFMAKCRNYKKSEKKRSNTNLNLN